MIKQILVLALCLFSLQAIAQDGNRLKDAVEEESPNTTKYRGLEIGINATTVLSKFVGNGSGIDAQDFPFLLRIHRDRFAIRLGLGANFKSDSFFDPTTFTNRDTEEKVGVLKVGMERKIDFKKRLSFYYGVDLFGGIIQESVSTSNFSSSDLSKEIYRYGGGPFFGISYSINERVRLHTETNILGYYEQATTTEMIAGTPVSSVSTDSVRASVEAPISLYINLKF